MTKRPISGRLGSWCWSCCKGAALASTSLPATFSCGHCTRTLPARCFRKGCPSAGPCATPCSAAWSRTQPSVCLPCGSWNTASGPRCRSCSSCLFGAKPTNPHRRRRGPHTSSAPCYQGFLMQGQQHNRPSWTKKTQTQAAGPARRVQGPPWAPPHVPVAAVERAPYPPLRAAAVAPRGSFRKNTTWRGARCRPAARGLACQARRGRAPQSAPAVLGRLRVQGRVCGRNAAVRAARGLAEPSDVKGMCALHHTCCGCVHLLLVTGSRRPPPADG